MREEGNDAAMARMFASFASLFGFLGVLFGAFGAHALSARLTLESFMLFEIGNRYLMYHALALFAVAWAEAKWGSRWIQASGWLFTFGILLFSGSLYCLALTGVKVWGMATLLGGLAFLIGWACLFKGLCCGKG